MLWHLKLRYFRLTGSRCKVCLSCILVGTTGNIIFQQYITCLYNRSLIFNEYDRNPKRIPGFHSRLKFDFSTLFSTFLLPHSTENHHESSLSDPFHFISEYPLLRFSQWFFPNSITHYGFSNSVYAIFNLNAINLSKIIKITPTYSFDAFLLHMCIIYTSYPLLSCINSTVKLPH